MFAVNVVSANSERHYSIASAGEAGWEVKLEEDRTVRWSETYDDWHRVERTRAKMLCEVSELLNSGWTIRTTDV
jgi:hypothetical protein